ncbi:TetR/AcrR family transcriptional regulator [Phototrophicus methaneseepsis]|uniref:TetR/AcrR family transcriptional regulator n=1 Tax=Phototrophicus methaneseepsis TaxID=2710758 RepID=A0A7S8IEU6_9CHLR|nr:TetR/AcrR family transcriptional regulator [Phototrophicus methaneseepsis]QPC82932.1 TetR/AcrR family transcriptional regulator [Phototrophicus methaneseepsis]
MAENAAPQKEDRRIQRTRNLLRDALLSLIEEKGYDSITVSDIADRANVARTTFYMHYSNKDDLLFRSMRDVYQTLFDQAMPSPQDFMDENCVDPSDFEHVREYADFYRVMLSDRGSMAFTVRVLDYLSEEFCQKMLKSILPTGHQTRVPLALQASMMSGSLIAIIKWWLDNGMQESPQEIAVMMQQMVFKGMLWSLNIDEDVIAAMQQ